MSTHAFLAPAAAHRWVRCHYAPTIEAAFPSPERPENLEGEAAHWVAAQAVQGFHIPVGTLAPNGIAVTQEMVEGAALVVGAMGGAMPAIEQRIDIPLTQNFGTPDYFAWRSRERLCIWDYKYGHEYVEVFENWQLIDYAAGILADVGGIEDQRIVVEFCIIQPRSYHRDGPVRYWKVRASDLRPYFNKLERAAELCRAPFPRATPSPEACKNCSGRHACEALQREAYSSAGRSQVGAIVEMSPEALGLEARTLSDAATLLQARLSGLQAEIEAHLQAGRAVPHWKMEQTSGRLEWSVPVEQVVAIGDMMGKDLRKPAAAITPTQSKLPPEILASVTTRKPGGVKAVVDDGSDARKIFTQGA